MKTKWLLSLTVILISLFSMSAFAAEPGISIGAKAGLNLSNIYDAEGSDFEADPKLGFAAGGFLSIPIGTFLGIQPEFLFSQRGLRGSGSILGSDYSFKRTTNHFDIPILLAIKPIPMLTILVGPQYSYLLSQDYKFDNQFITVNQQEEFENDNIRRNTLGITGGVDVNLNPMVVSARVGWDLTDNKGDGTSSTPRYKNTWLQATLGYRF